MLGFGRSVANRLLCVLSVHSRIRPNRKTNELLAKVNSYKITVVRETRFALQTTRDSFTCNIIAAASGSVTSALNPVNCEPGRYCWRRLDVARTCDPSELREPRGDGAAGSCVGVANRDDEIHA